MILSYKNNFCFIKGKKVAGTSVEIALSIVCGSDDIITPITPVDERARFLAGGRQPQNYGASEEALLEFNQAMREEDLAKLALRGSPNGIFYNHMPLKKVLRLHGPLPKGMRLFAVERSPYSKVISAANMHVAFSGYRTTGDKMSATHAEVSAEVDRLIAKDSLKGYYNLPRYLDRSGAMNLTILRFENLRNELNEFLVERGVEKPPQLPHAKEGLGSEALVKDILNARQIEYINVLFDDEFKTFGYDKIS